MKNWLYPGPTISYIVGLLGLGFSMSGLPTSLQVTTVIVSLLILVFTALIKLEEYQKKRYERLIREEIRGFKVFMKFAEEHSDEFEELDQEVLEDLEEAHEQFRKEE